MEIDWKFDENHKSLDSDSYLAIKHNFTGVLAVAKYIIYGLCLSELKWLKCI